MENASRPRPKEAKKAENQDGKVLKNPSPHDVLETERDLRARLADMERRLRAVEEGQGSMPLIQ